MLVRIAGRALDRFATPILVGLGVSLSFVMAAALFHAADVTVDSKLERNVGTYVRELREQLDLYDAFLDTARMQLAAQADMRPADAYEHAEPVLRRLAGLRGLGWLDGADASKLLLSTAWDPQGLDDGGLPSTLVHDAPPAGGAIPLLETVAVAASRIANLPGLMSYSCRTGRIVVGELIDPASVAGVPGAHRHSIVLLAPVHTNAAAIHRGADRDAGGEVAHGSLCDDVRGFVVVAAWTDQIAARAFAHIAWRDGTLGVLDLSAPPERRLLASFGALQPVEEATLLASGQHLHSMDVGGRHWGIVVHRPLTSRLQMAYGEPSAALLIGLAFTGLMAGHLRRERRIKGLYQVEARARAAMTRALRVSEERIHLALRHSRLILANLDRDLRYTWYYDPQTMRSNEEMVGHSNADLFSAQDAAVLDRIMRRVMETNLGSRQQLRLRVRGTERAFDFVVEPLRREDGGVAGVTCAAMDITEFWRTREALADARAAAESANFAKSRFLAAASHDLRQPFQAMSLFHHILTDMLHDPKQKEIAAKLGDALTAGNALLATLLDISTLEIGSVQPKLAAFPVQNLVDRLGNEFAAQAASRGLSFRLAVNSAMVCSDPVLLERMIRNLLVNALRYTRTGGILLGCRRRGDRLRIEVIDTGPGIPPDQLERIFEEFFRCDTDRRENSAGLGLGLAIVRRMSEILHHPVTVRSRVGRGTMFAISVPLAAADTEAGEADGMACTAPSAAHPGQAASAASSAG